MGEVGNLKGLKLIYVVANYGMGSKILKEAMKCGISQGTIVHGYGTVDNAILKFLGLYDERKEIVIFGADESLVEKTMERLNKVFHFEKPNHGIAYEIDLLSCFRGEEILENHREIEEKGTGSMYKLIITIVNRGMAENVVEVAQKAGAQGGTIINGRGTEHDKVTKVFNMEIEPEKEIVMILSKKEITEQIVDTIRENLNINEIGEGIIFVQDVEKTYGIYEGKE